MSPQHTGALMVLVSAAGFATLAILIKLAYAAGANTITILATRFILAAACLWLILHWRNISYRVDRHMLLRLFLLGGLGYGAMSTAFASSLKFLPASLSSMLLYMYPAIVSVLAIFLGQDQLSWRKSLALIICFSGLFLTLGVSFEGMSMLGLGWGIAAAIIYSLYILAGNYLLRDVKPLVATTYVCSSAAIVFVLTAIGTNDFVLSLPLYGWLSLAGMALFSTVIGILGFFAGMTRIGPANASIISIAEPVMTVLMSIFFLGETIIATQIGGGLLILMGLIILQCQKSEERPVPLSDPS